MRSFSYCSILLLILSLATIRHIQGEDEPTITANRSSPPTDRPMRVVIHADGTASLAPDDEDVQTGTGSGNASPSSTSMPAGIILPSFDATSGLVPLWMIERDRLAKEAEEKAKEEERLKAYQEQQAAKRQAEAEAEAERAKAQAAAWEEERLRNEKEAHEREQNKIRAMLEERDRKKREEQQQQQQQPSSQPQHDQHSQPPQSDQSQRAQPETHQQQQQEQSTPNPSQSSESNQHHQTESDREQQQQQQQQHQQQQHEQQHSDQHAEEQRHRESIEAAEREVEENRRRQEESDEIAAAAARAFAEQGLVKVDDATNQLAQHDPAQALFDSLQRSAYFRELTPHNAWHYVQQNRPFAMLVLCRCAYDSDLDIVTLENLITDAGLQHRYTFLWAQMPTIQQFSIYNTYGLQDGRPAFVIDNIPVGQHVEKYLFPGRVERAHTATPQELFTFLSDFFIAPTPLKLILRTKEKPEKPFNIDQDRGHVVEVVGSTFEEIVLHSPYSVLIMLYSPTCPGCHTALPILDQVAESLAWTNRDVIVAKMDRTANDVPLVLKFQSYPALFLYKAGLKVYDTTSDGGEEAHRRGSVGSRGFRIPIDYYGPNENPRDGNSCSAPLNAQDLEAWIQRHVNGGGNLLGMNGGFGSSPSQQSTSSPATEQSLPPEPTEFHSPPIAPQDPSQPNGNSESPQPGVAI